MIEIVQHNHSVGYWQTGRRSDMENFIELANFAIKFIRHVNLLQNSTVTIILGFLQENPL